MRAPRLAMNTVVAPLLAISLASLSTWCQAADQPGPTPEDFFRDRVRPILSDSCWRCHGERRQRSGLRLDSRAGVLHGGHNAIVVLGQPEKSRLMDVLGYEDEDAKMPPDGKLSDREIADIATWIRMGVPWDDRPTRAAKPPGAASGAGRRSAVGTA